MILFLLSFFSSLAQESIYFKEIGSLEMERISKEKRKYTFIYFTNPGCAPCKVMEKTVYVNPSVFSLYNKEFVNIKADCRKEKPEALLLQERYKVVAFPTLLFIDTLGNVIHKKVGFADAKKMIELVEQAKGSENLANWQKRYSKGEISLKLVESLLEYEDKPLVFIEENYVCKAQEVLDKYFASIKTQEFAEKKNWELIKKYVANPNSNVFEYVAKNQNEFIKKFGEKEVNIKIYETYFDYVSGNTSLNRWKKAMQELQRSEVKQAKAVLEYRRLQSEFSVLSKQSKWEEFVKQADPFISEYYYLINKYQLNDWVNAVLKTDIKNKTILCMMQLWMENLLSDPKIDDYDLYVTHAEIYFQLGKKVIAQKKLLKGIELAHKNVADAEELDLLKIKLKRYKLETD
jgi:thioredoxin-related protein